MSKELKLLKRIWEMVGTKKDYAIIEKTLKALEIVKETLPIEEEDFFYDKETDTYFFIGYKVSKEQFYLLKEVLL